MKQLELPFPNRNPTDSELETIEEQLAADELRAQLPATETAAFDMGRGDEAPRAEPTYGKRRVVGRVATGGGMNRENAERILHERGVVWEEVFQTARWWTAVVYE